MKKERTMSMDRIFAIILFLGSIFIAIDLRYSVTTNHNLWSLPVVSNIIWPFGLIVVLFWGVASLGRLNNNILHTGWVISAVWHFGWLSFLIITIFGFLGMLSAAPLMLFWLLFSGVLSLAAAMKIREAQREILA